MPTENAKNKKLVVVYGELIVDEAGKIVRKLKKEDRVTSLNEAEAKILVSDGVIPEPWEVFGNLHHSLVHQSFMNLYFAQAVTRTPEGRGWDHSKVAVGAVSGARLSGMALLCWLPEE